ncbi:MAG: nuclear transport factor 2 family protein [Chloroflexi bacterium]|nr:nuclear transport factor 2 family protein [Chloroflexota bacterium]
MSRQREVAESYWRAECARDVAGVLAHYQPDARFRAPGWDLTGHGEIRAYYEASAASFPGLEVTVVGDYGDGETAVVEWDAVLIDPDGQRHPIQGVNVITLRDDRFADVRAYFDTSRLPRSE